MFTLPKEGFIPRNPWGHGLAEEKQYLSAYCFEKNEFLVLPPWFYIKGNTYFFIYQNIHMNRRISPANATSRIYSLSKFHFWRDPARLGTTGHRDPIGPKNSVGKIRCRDAPSPNFFLLRFSGLCFVQRYFVVQDSEFSALTVSFRFINGYYFSNRWWDIGPDVGDGAPIWEGVMAPFLMALAPSLMRNIPIM